MYKRQAESTASALRFPPDLDGAGQVTEGETASFNARARSLSEGVESTRRSVALVQRELGIAESMSAKGLMSEVEVMRLRRQVNEPPRARCPPRPPSARGSAPSATSRHS